MSVEIKYEALPEQGSGKNSMERLGFVLPDFTRTTWANEKARETWAPRLRRINRAWSDIEWASVVLGVRPCALTPLSPEAFLSAAPRWAERGLAALPVALEGRSDSSYSNTPPSVVPGKPVVLRLVVGSLAHVVRFHEAWQAKNDDEIARFLGYPACCREFFKQKWVDGESIDTTWEMAASTSGSARSTAGTELEVNGPWMSNILWRWMGVRAVPHLPCSFDCDATVRFAEELREVGIRVGYAVEMDWIKEILSWPVEWTALHGIAEVKTPVLKVSTRTDATPRRYAVRWKGSGYPEEGVQGLAFPYRTPARPIVTSSSAFQRGLDNLIQLQPARPAWHHLDNGFKVRHAMDAQHQPLVTLARAQLQGVRGNVLDVGCGNGVLLEKICRDREGLVPYGIDLKNDALLHVKEVLPQFSANFVRRDLFDPEFWAGPRRYELGILMVGRLLEVPQEKAAILLAGITTTCSRVLLYMYPGWSKEPFGTLVERAGLRLQEGSGPTSGMAVL